MGIKGLTIFRIAVAMLVLIVPAESGLAKCKLGKLAELPVTMAGSSPTIPVKINGIDVRLIADSGAFYSIITAASAAELKLKLEPAPGDLRLVGVAGSTEAWVTTVKQFTLGNAPIPRMEFIVGGSEPGYGAAGYLGQNVLGVADVEYDIANGAIRLMQADGCAKTELAYWATTTSYSVIDIDPPSARWSKTSGVAYVNGAKIHVIFDTGASTSILTLRAAARAGVAPGAPGVLPAGLSRGIGRGTANTWIAPFASFRIGDEEVRNTRLRFGDVSLEDADMLIGADFFLSHRVFVANSQHKLYFTYNGGPVFNLSSNPEAQPADAAPESGDASAFSRRGAAFAARHAYKDAIAELTRACELAPDNSAYFYERGTIRIADSQTALAKADFEQAIQLKPDYVEALVARAALRRFEGDKAGAGSDLDAADRFAAKEADIRFAMAIIYEQAGMFEPAVTQYDLWIAAHDRDVKLATALNGRCWNRALWNHDLDKALNDCSAALKLNSNSAAILDSRGLVRLRLGQFDKSIADYDEALRLEPKIAWSLYGRGVDELRKGMKSAGQADIDAATALRPSLPEEAREYGITP
jgi:tetratricopeptide (TPR) repeat protein